MVSLGYTWVTLEKEFTGYPQFKVQLAAFVDSDVEFRVLAVPSNWLPK